MRTPRPAMPAIAAVLAAATLAACSSAGGQAATLANPTTTAGAHTTASTADTGYPTSAQLQNELLAITDMPTGWSAVPDTGSGGAASCPALNGGGRMPSNAKAQYEKSALGPLVGEGLAAGSAAAENADWSRVQTALNTCRSYTSDNGDGTTTAWTLSALSFPAYGQATYALAVTATDSGVTLSGDVILVRKAGVLVTVTVLGVGGVDVGTVEGFVGKAVGKIG